MYVSVISHISNSMKLMICSDICILVLYIQKCIYYYIGGVMVHALASDMEARGFESLITLIDNFASSTSRHKRDSNPHVKGDKH